MPRTQITATTRAKIDPSAMVSSISRGQPALIITDDGNGVITIGPCPDGKTPDCVIGLMGASKTTGGQLVAVSPGCPISLGGTVAKGDKLTPSGGNWGKAAAKDEYQLIASAAGVAGDTITAMLPVMVA